MGEKTVIFNHLYINAIFFTKTGSRQTYGKLTKSAVFPQDPITQRFDPQKQVEGVGPTLYDDVFSEIGGDHRRLLMYRFRQSTSGLMHVPRQKLIRADDMPSNFPIDAIAQHDYI